MFLCKPVRVKPIFYLTLLFWVILLNAMGNEVTVNNATGLRTALRAAIPGTTILLLPGNYGNGIQISNISGTPEKPITIAAADKQNLPVFQGGGQALHFVDCNYITLSGIIVSGSTSNGINADDGGSFETPSKGMVFDNITIENIGPTGNHDALKMSGLQNFVVRNCTFSGWGGSAIDMVGCQDGIIEHCQFIGKEGYSQDHGVQTKGGTERILIHLNFFKNAGQRGINIGGSTGFAYFRPKLQNYEAKDIEVAGNHFVGSAAPVAYVTSINCSVHHNTIINPEKWVMRILQEQSLDQFLPCQQGIFESNLVVFDRRVQVFVNIGPNTLPETFTFNNNAWYSSDLNRKPSLPAEETNGIYQENPLLQNAETPEIKIESKDPRILKLGAHAYITAKAQKNFSYQSVIRNNNDELILNSAVGMQINILQGSESGTVVYSETQKPNTNSNGLVSIGIGGKSGFDDIDWTVGPYFIKTEIDPTGGTNYTIIDTNKLLSVPFALHSNTADSVAGSLAEVDPAFESSAVSGITGKDIDVWNNKQSLLIAGNGIKITGNVISIDEDYFKGDITKAVDQLGPGIALQYPGDEGIETHPSVVLTENFEEESIALIANRWTSNLGADDHRLSLDSISGPLGSPGNKSLKMTISRNKEGSGSELRKVLDNRYEQLFLRFYVKFAEDYGFNHHFTSMRGELNPTPWSVGGAGTLPEDRFSTTIDLFTNNINLTGPDHSPPGYWAFYSYWPEMRSWQNPDGTPDGRPNPYYGNAFMPNQPVAAKRGEWQCVEIMIRVNSSPDKTDGAHAFWIDGELVGHWDPEEENPIEGYWISDKFRHDPSHSNAEPFTGIKWRTFEDMEIFENMKINIIRIQNYVSGTSWEHADKYAAENPEFKINLQEATVWKDHIVVATEYIGPMNQNND